MYAKNVYVKIVYVQLKKKNRLVKIQIKYKREC